MGGDGEVVPGRHFLEELANEHLEMGDAYHILRSGVIYDPPETDIRTGEEKWRIRGQALDDSRDVAIVFSFKAIDRAYLITIFTVKSYRRG